MILKSFPTTIYGDIWSNHLDNSSSTQLDAPSLYVLLVLPSMLGYPLSFPLGLLPVATGAQWKPVQVHVVSGGGHWKPHIDIRGRSSR